MELRSAVRGSRSSLRALNIKLWIPWRSRSQQGAVAVPRSGPSRVRLLLAAPGAACVGNVVEAAELWHNFFPPPGSASLGSR